MKKILFGNKSCKYDTFSYVSIMLFVISVIVQILLVALYNGTQVSDSASYLELAKNAVENNTWYPNQNSIYTNYIWAPGLVNYFVLLIYLFKSTKVILYFNVLLNIILALEIFYIARKYLNILTANIFIIVYALYPITYGSILYTASELPFMVLCYGAIIFMLKNNYKYYILAGIMAALANWIRPFLPVMILVAIFICGRILSVNKMKYFLIYTFSVFLTIMCIGMATHSRIGYFNFQSTTSGVNLIMGANDDADGSYDNKVFKEGNIGFIEDKNSLTFAQRDSLWQARSIDWIKSNPQKWLLLFPKKIFYLFATDLYALAPLTGDMKIQVESREYIYDIIKNFPDLKKGDWLLVYNQFFYFIMLLLSLFGIFYLAKSKNEVFFVLIIWVIFLMSMILITVGGGRYHYTFVYLLMLFASFFISQIIVKYTKNRFTL